MSKRFSERLQDLIDAKKSELRSVLASLRSGLEIGGDAIPDRVLLRKCSDISQLEDELCRLQFKMDKLIRKQEGFKI